MSKRESKPDCCLLLRTVDRTAWIVRSRIEPLPALPSAHGMEPEQHLEQVRRRVSPRCRTRRRQDQKHSAPFVLAVVTGAVKVDTAARSAVGAVAGDR